MNGRVPKVGTIQSVGIHLGTDTQMLQIVCGGGDIGFATWRELGLHPPQDHCPRQVSLKSSPAGLHLSLVSQNWLAFFFFLSPRIS